MDCSGGEMRTGNRPQITPINTDLKAIKRKRPVFNLRESVKSVDKNSGVIFI
jgi:hypothetical protein